MNLIEKGLGILMWATVALMVIIFFASIMIGHATNYQFLSSIPNIPVLSETVVSYSKTLV